MNLPNTKDIFCEALELSGTERHAYLDRTCGVDGPLRDRVLSLLSAAERGGAFLSATVMEPGAHRDSSTSDEDIGGSIGPYNLVELIGEGGFGSVFKAVQTLPVRRVVALKVIKLGMDTKSVVARFEQERQSQSIMDHPHIAKVLEAGATKSGRPYFVMELVQGTAITTYCDVHSLDIPQRLRLFAQVCHAVQHAHTKGVIHRDLKPSNILVTSSGDGPFARVIDFGIAKATQSSAGESTSLTQNHQCVGTPQYMSPEQARGSIDIDTRSDVYSLGVLLYELLSGSTPFDPAALRSAGLIEMRRVLAEDDPPTPSTRVSQSAELSSLAAVRGVEPVRLGSLLRDELDWIVMRALEKERSRRYGSPDELAADLLRYMNGDAVVAVPPSRAYRLRKIVARHRGPVLSVCAAGTAVIVGLGAALWQASVANNERREANQRRLETEEIVSFQAEQLRGIDPSSMGSVIRSDLIEGFRASMEQSLLTAQAREVREKEFMSLLDEANFTDVALKTLETSIMERTTSAIRERFAGQPLVQAQLLLSTAETMRNLGMLKAAYSPLSQALDIRRSNLGQDHPLTIATLVSMGRLQLISNNLDEAETSLDDASRRAERVFGPEAAGTLEALNALGLLYQARSRFDESERLFRRVLDSRRRTLGADQTDSIRSLANLASLLAVRGRTAQSIEMHTEALDRIVRVRGPEHADTLALKYTYSILLRQQKRTAESEAILRSVLEVRRRTRGASHHETLATLNQLGMTLKTQGRLSEAEPLYREALSSYRRTIGPTHRQTIDTMKNLAALLSLTQRPIEAEALLREALSGSERTSGVASLTASITRHDLAQLLKQEHRFPEAEALYLQALDATKNSINASDAHAKVILTGLADLYESWDAEEPGQGYDQRARQARDNAAGTRGP